MSGATQIVDAYWDRFLAVEPLFATAVGDARFDELLPDPSEAGRTERHRVHSGLLEAAAAIDASGLDPEERRTLALAVALARCRPHFEEPTWRAFELAWLQKRPAAEVAEALGLPIDKVYVAKSRVLGRLEQEVRDLAEDGVLFDHYPAGERGASAP